MNIILFLTTVFNIIVANFAKFVLMVKPEKTNTFKKVLQDRKIIKDCVQTRDYSKFPNLLMDFLSVNQKKELAEIVIKMYETAVYEKYYIQL